MKKFGMIMLLVLIVGAFAAIAKDNGNSGAIWTTTSSCGVDPQDENQYKVGDVVYINAEGFKSGSYEWKITGQPGHASCDPNEDVASGSEEIGSDGKLCFAAYTVAEDDCGEYKADFGGKKDNYRLVGEVPEFGVTSALVIIALGGVFVLVKRN